MGGVQRRTAEEIDYLEKSFLENPLPNEVRRIQIAKVLEIEERKVMIWFQNKRQRMKQRMKYVENANLKEENETLQRALNEERQRGEYLRRENRELKVMLGPASSAWRSCARAHPGSSSSTTPTSLRQATPRRRRPSRKSPRPLGWTILRAKFTRSTQTACPAARRRMASAHPEPLRNMWL